MKLIVGLGNPGKKYQGTRHNIGFDVVDYISANESWREIEGGGLMAEVSLDGGERVRLLKPQSYMNLSGSAVIAVMAYYKIQIDDLIICHDELDLPLGLIKIKRGGGDGGHNGLRSITDRLNSPDYIRIRCGIGRPAPQQDGQPSLIAVSDWVLGRFEKADAPKVEELIKVGAGAVSEVCTKGMISAQNRFNCVKLNGDI